MEGKEDAMARCGKLLLISSCLLLGSCTSAVWLRGGPDYHGKKRGIPFYVTKQAFKQTTVYEQLWYEVTLVVSFRFVPEGSTDGKPITVSNPPTTVLAPISDGGKINEIQKLLMHQPLSKDALTDVYDKLGDLDRLSPDELSQHKVGNPVTNSVEPIAVVDYAHTYYLNGPLPWFGSSTVTTKLNPNGTLSEGTVAPTSSPEKIADLLPIKEVLQARLTPKNPDEAKELGLRREPSTGSSIETFATLTVETKGYRYTFVAIHQNDPCVHRRDGFCSLEAIPFDASSGNFTRTVIGAGGQAKGKDGGKKVSFSGAVTLPKK